MNTRMRVYRPKKIRLTLAYIGAVFIVALPFLFSFYVVVGESMAPVYKDGQVILVERFSRFIIPLGRTEVVVMHNPHKPVEIITKRIIGLPGESVRVGTHEVIITHTGGTQDHFGEDTIIGGGSSGDNVMQFVMTLGPEDYFVLGDNRQTSLDSRIFGAVQPQDVIGRVVWKTPVLLK